jgi:hypothetical protein
MLRLIGDRSAPSREAVEAVRQRNAAALPALKAEAERRKPGMLGLLGQAARERADYVASDARGFLSQNNLGAMAQGLGDAIGDVGKGGYHAVAGTIDELRGDIAGSREHAKAAEASSGRTYDRFRQSFGVDNNGVLTKLGRAAGYAAGGDRSLAAATAQNAVNGVWKGLEDHPTAAIAQLALSRVGGRALPSAVAREGGLAAESALKPSLSVVGRRAAVGLRDQAGLDALAKARRGLPVATGSVSRMLSGDGETGMPGMNAAVSATSANALRDAQKSVRSEKVGGGSGQSDAVATNDLDESSANRLRPKAEFVKGPIIKYKDAFKDPGYEWNHINNHVKPGTKEYREGYVFRVLNENSGGKVEGGLNAHTGAEGIHVAKRQYERAITPKGTKYKSLPQAKRELDTRRFYASLGIHAPE